MAVELTDDSSGGKNRANGLFEPLKVLRPLIAFGTNRKQGFSTFTFTFTVQLSTFTFQFSIFNLLTPVNFTNKYR